MNPLPFLKDKKNQSAGVVVEHRSESEEKDNPGLMACASEFLSAIEKKDVKGVARAMQNAFELLESMPHEEGDNEIG